MGRFFEELARKVAERWVMLLVLPGALFVLLAVVGVRLGHADPFDVAEVERTISGVADTVSGRFGAQVLLLVAVLLAATGTGLAVQALAGVTRLVWLGRWPRPLSRWVVRRRRARWHALLDRRRALARDHPARTRTAERQEEIDSLAARMTRIAPAEPGRPTWMGDRMHAVEQVALHRHGLDLAFGWSRLWLVLPDTVRAEVVAAEAAFAGAVASGTWAWPYLVLGVLWWPALLIGFGIGVTGWARARAAVGDLAALSEASIDLHGRTLAAALGVGDDSTTGPLTVAEGREITAIVRKGR
ncbi:hypothetical protein OG985_43285 [Streptomyces sp. NBC_00289]|uniref:hypothetical protein n=1 Tax=Streptomyces sp. NBC_00289 TaxID=2975703 RepID=UPI0032499C2B